MKPLYDKANELWQTLAAIKQQAHAGFAPDPEIIGQVLKDNRPTIVEQPELADLRLKLISALASLQQAYTDTQELPYVNRMLKVAIWNITRPPLADHCQHSDDVQDEPPFESPEPQPNS